MDYRGSSRISGNEKGGTHGWFTNGNGEDT
jgi:hypothetical protein